MTEGVIKFSAELTGNSIITAEQIAELNKWRKILYDKRLVGEEGGIGFGNLSMRLPPFNAQPGKRAFITTASQTGALAELKLEHYSEVCSYNQEKNSVTFKRLGDLKPSSESMTHGAVYDSDSTIRFVFHAHSPEIWQAAMQNKLIMPITDRDAQYGTPEMAEAVMKLFKTSNVKTARIFAMGGHENGIISFGSTAKEAGEIMLKAHDAAIKLIMEK